MVSLALALLLLLLAGHSSCAADTSVDVAGPIIRLVDVHVSGAKQNVPTKPHNETEQAEVEEEERVQITLAEIAAAVQAGAKEVAKEVDKTLIKVCMQHMWACMRLSQRISCCSGIRQRISHPGRGQVIRRCTDARRH